MHSMCCFVFNYSSFFIVWYVFSTQQTSEFLLGCFFKWHLKHEVMKTSSYKCQADGLPPPNDWLCESQKHLGFVKSIACLVVLFFLREDDFLKNIHVVSLLWKDEMVCCVDKLPVISWWTIRYLITGLVRWWLQFFTGGWPFKHFPIEIDIKSALPLMISPKS